MTRTQLEAYRRENGVKAEVRLIGMLRRGHSYGEAAEALKEFPCPYPMGWRRDSVIRFHWAINRDWSVKS